MAGQGSSTAAMEEDKLRIEMLGAGQEVGRSCCFISFKGFNIVCDAGVHPAYTGLSALPFLDQVDWSTVDALLITHFHLDHAAALTYIMEKTNFRDGKGKVYMTHPTKAIYRFLMSDFVRISNAGSDRMLFDESEMLASWRQIEAVDYHQEVVVSGGLRFTPYHAGHVLGACMFLIDIAGLRVLYTGDYSREEDRHLVQAEVPPVRPDVLICESTYGTQSLEPRLEKEMRFTALIHSIIKRGGRVLLPVFVLGRAQELLLLLDEYWSAHPELHTVPIYYASSLARKCMSIYQTYIHTMNQHIRTRFNRRDNPFVFKHVSNLRSLDKFEDKGPCVMMASPGFMQSGISRELLERWAPDKRNGVIVSGYSVEGTMARDILSDPDEIIAMNGQRIPRRLSVDYISFSAHVDYTQNSHFIDEVRAKHVVLVHGELKNMSGLRAALQSRYHGRAEEVHLYMPRNCDPLFIPFRPDRTAKVIGALAEKPAAEGKAINGLLVAKDFSYTVLAPEDLAEFTGLGTSVIVQRQRVALNVGWEVVRWHLEGMYGTVQEGVDVQGVKTLRVMNVVDIKQPRTHELVLEWVSSVSNDMVADSAVALLLGIDSCPATVKMTMHDHACAHASPKPDERREQHFAFVESLSALLEAHFGQVEMIEVGGMTDAESEARPLLSNTPANTDAGARASPAPPATGEQHTPDAPTEAPAEAPAEAPLAHDAWATDGSAAPASPPRSPTASPPHSPAPAVSPLEALCNRIYGPLRAAIKVELDGEPVVIELEHLRLVSMMRTTSQSLSDSFHLIPPSSTMLFQGEHSEVELDEKIRTIDSDSS
ncbi:endoribonuclease ysh1 [Malassezia brasiliensis]|uniref:Endoribonuclease YSH1 n=1 Tax=Malassezia brasiliensis TaxID=1821822 RepID=A0AAF0INM9_9BASI|nr:endoribonuclease ysh1 [Malassezia brasiliensis]